MANWWLPDGLPVYMGGWGEAQWVEFLGFSDPGEVKDFCLRGLDILGRAAESHSLSRTQIITRGLGIPYVRTNVFAREEPAQKHDWSHRCFALYAEAFEVPMLKRTEVLRLPPELQAAIAWQVAPAMRALREALGSAAAVLKHVLKSSKDLGAMDDMHRGVYCVALMALSDVFCAPELLQLMLEEAQTGEILREEFPSMRELDKHVRSYRRNMPVSLQVMLGTSGILADEFASDLQEFALTGSDPAMCYDKLREVKALVDVAVDLTEHALPALIERTLEEHVIQPVKAMLKDGVSRPVRQAGTRLLQGSAAMIDKALEGASFGNLLDHPWKRWTAQVLQAMRAALKAQAELEKRVLDKAKDPVKNLKALQELAVEVDAFEGAAVCQALNDLLAHEPEQMVVAMVRPQAAEPQATKAPSPSASASAAAPDPASPAPAPARKTAPGDVASSLGADVSSKPRGETFADQPPRAARPPRSGGGSGSGSGGGDRARPPRPRHNP
jgi:hypothetical protein